MKLLYLTSVNFQEKKYQGVINKINYQIKGFKKNNIDVTHYNFDAVNNNTIKKILRRISIFASNSYINSNIELNFQEYDFVYIRYTLSDYKFIKLLKKIKERKKDIKIIVEIPTYPYIDEYKNNKKMFLLRDSIFKKYLKKYVYRISTFSSDSEIYGCKTININNGIDLEEILLQKKPEFKNELNIIAVANISFWHGYDRLIKGIAKYNKLNPKIKVNFNIVGNGAEEKKLKELVKDLNLEENIKFLGYKSGKDLDEEFNKNHLAVDHLGLHRKNLKELSSLKSKEYAARGIPFILSHKDKAFDKFKYLYLEEANEKEANVEEIVKFFLEIKEDENYGEKIREYSNRFTWTKITKDIINKFN